MLGWLGCLVYLIVIFLFIYGLAGPIPAGIWAVFYGWVLISSIVDDRRERHGHTPTSNRVDGRYSNTFEGRVIDSAIRDMKRDERRNK